MKKPQLKPVLFIALGIFLLIISISGCIGVSEIRQQPVNKESDVKTKEVCIFKEEPETVPEGPVISMPFNLEDYYPKYWGMAPFCADPWKGGNIHWALDFELKPDSKVFAATDGVVEHTEVGQKEGSGEIISVTGDGFKMDYSGLTNLQVKASDEIKKGDYIANTVRIPHGEYHVHIGIFINGTPQCPVKYMDEEFKEALKEMFSRAHYPRMSEAPCVCNCEYFE